MNPMKETENKILTMISKVIAPALVGVPRTSQLKQETIGLIQKRAVTKKKKKKGLRARWNTRTNLKMNWTIVLIALAMMKVSDFDIQISWPSVGEIYY